jgi:hypothetical protein
MFSLSVSWQMMSTQELQHSHSRYHCNTIYIKTSNHTLILPFTGWLSRLNCHALNNTDDSIRLLCSQSHILAVWCLELDWLKRPSVSFTTIRHGPQQKTVSTRTYREHPSSSLLLLWRHRARGSCASFIATVRARTTESIAPVLLAACVLRALPSNGAIFHNILTELTRFCSVVDR